MERGKEGWGERGRGEEEEERRGRGRRKGEQREEKGIRKEHNILQ